MVNFWGIFVVFSACAAFQLAESRIQHDYRPNSLSASDEFSDISNSLRLSERREALYLFAENLQIQYSKDYVGKTRDVLNKLILELEASRAKSDNVEERLIELKDTLKELEAFDIESDNLEEASDIVHDLIDELDYTENEPPQVVAALRKVGWIDVGNELSDEMVAITDKFVRAFNQFVATLTPWERLTEAGLVDLNRRFNEVSTDDQWDLFPEFWTYFE